jgi:hypothetical protein
LRSSGAQVQKDFLPEPPETGPTELTKALSIPIHLYTESPEYTELGRKISPKGPDIEVSKVSKGSPGRVPEVPEG